MAAHEMDCGGIWHVRIRVCEKRNGKDVREKHPALSKELVSLYHDMLEEIQMEVQLPELRRRPLLDVEPLAPFSQGISLALVSNR
jgi:hypothetical protein